MARPKIKLRAKDYPAIKSMAERGCDQKTIARGLGMSWDTWKRILREDKRALEAFEAGREVEHEELFGSLYKAATDDGNVAAAMFLLKCRHGYREQAPAQQESRVTIEMRLPAPLKPGDYTRVIEHEQPAQLVHEEIPDD